MEIVQIGRGGGEGGGEERGAERSIRSKVPKGGTHGRFRCLCVFVGFNELSVVAHSESTTSNTSRRIPKKEEEEKEEEEELIQNQSGRAPSLSVFVCLLDSMT